MRHRADATARSARAAIRSRARRDRSSSAPTSCGRFRQARGCWARFVRRMTARRHSGTVAHPGVDPADEPGRAVRGAADWAADRVAERAADSTADWAAVLAAYRDMADAAYVVLQPDFFDAEHGGYFWSLDAQDQPLASLTSFNGAADFVRGSTFVQQPTQLVLRASMGPQTSSADQHEEHYVGTITTRGFNGAADFVRGSTRCSSLMRGHVTKLQWGRRLRPRINGNTQMGGCGKWSFNGAADFVRGSTRNPIRPLDTIGCFNGAADFVRGSTSPVHTWYWCVETVLQWGRRLRPRINLEHTTRHAPVSEASMGPQTSSADQRSKRSWRTFRRGRASMGPQTSSADQRRRKNGSGPARCGLQWGRRLRPRINLRPCHCYAFRQPCFNGAADFVRGSTR